MKRPLLTLFCFGALFVSAQQTDSFLSTSAPIVQSIHIPCHETPTKSEGLLQSHWTQSAPYNSMCPKDPVTNSSSYAGCPAVAMAQIINYLQTTQNTRFHDNDDYHHAYYGRNYTIDDDYETLKFPSFPILNQYLDKIDSIYALDESIDNELAAALIFACGTACKQVYTSQGSGTFQVSQAYDAYRRFGFNQCVLFYEATDDMYDLLIQNLQEGYPAHLAIESPDGNSGHNVVVDGYNPADSTFHMNFGYGGMEDGWYKIPDPNFPYGLSELEGIILNIIPTPLSIEEITMPHPRIYPNPTCGQVSIEGNDLQHLSILNMFGQSLIEQDIISNKADFDMSHFSAGIYLIRITTSQGEFTTKLIKK